MRIADRLAVGPPNLLGPSVQGAGGQDSPQTSLPSPWPVPSTGSDIGGRRAWSLGQEDLLQKEIATHSSILAWEIPWTEETGAPQFMGSRGVGHD